MDWLFVTRHVTGDFAQFQPLRNYPDDYQLDMGIPLQESFPPDAELRMNPDFRDQVALADSLYFPGSFLVVNDRVRDLLSMKDVGNVEWLPLKVLNHKGKPVKDQYFIANILSLVDCIDLKKSTVEWNDINPELICAAAKLVIDEGRCPSNLKLFRPVHMEFEMMIHRSLADAIMAENLSGFLFREVAEFKY